MSEPGRSVQSRRRLGFPTTSAAYLEISPTRNKNETSTSSGHGSQTQDEVASDHQEGVTSFLKKNSQFLDYFVLQHISQERIRHWLHMSEHQPCRPPSYQIQDEDTNQQCSAHHSRYSTPDISQLQRILLNAVKASDDLNPILYELTHVIGTGISADGFSYYCICSGGKELAQYVPHTDISSQYDRVLHGPIGAGSTIAAYCAHVASAVYMDNISTDDRFPKGLGIGEDETLYQSAICIPVTLPSNDIIGVMQFTRGWEKQPFPAAEYQIALSLVTWIGVAISTIQMNNTLVQQLDVEEFLLDVSKGMFDDMTQLTLVSEKIMKYTKNLLSAERCALFLLDPVKEELYSNLLDEGVVQNGESVFRRSDTIRFPIAKGIAGYVAQSQEVVNIKDAYADTRFNREIDRATGFITRNILCMPIVTKNEVVGVIQMVNKKNGDCFTNADVNSFKMFSVFCALALHFSKLFEELNVKGAQLQVALEQMSYHLKYPEEEAESSRQPDCMIEEGNLPPLFNTFFFTTDDEMAGILPNLYVHMVYDLLGRDSFNYPRLWQFVLTVKKNYRPLPYHNWLHGFSVAHCMYMLLKNVKDKEVFNEIEMKALMVATVSHDVDHRGYSNAFLSKAEQPLSVLYSTSTMEQHHYNHTVTIIQQKKHDIFADLKPEDYKEALRLLRQTILATDLALFIPTLRKLNILFDGGHADLSELDTRMLVTSIMMTGADLSSVCKPFPHQQKTLRNIYEEFYQQGDREKAMGLKPIPMMDRDYQHNQPHDQCAFIDIICKPCYSFLAKLFVEWSPLLSGCLDNYAQWQCVIEGKPTTMWEPMKSVPKSVGHSSEEN